MKNLILYNGKISTVDKKNPSATAVAIKDGKFIAVGSDQEVLKYKTDDTKVIDLKKKRVIPGLNDSHLHLIRGGLHFNMELRWDGVPSLAEALRLLKVQAQRTPSPQWVRVIGGWSEFQFEERRMPTLEEINAIAPETPVMILHLYDRLLLNRAALVAAGFNKNTPNPKTGIIQRDSNGNPTGLLIANPNASLLYATIANAPLLPHDYQVNSTKHFLKEMNRLGVTSMIDAGGGFQKYPDDYKVINELNDKDELTVRIAYNLFTQNAGGELADFEKWTKESILYNGSDKFRLNGAGEMLTFSAADFEDFLQPRQDLPNNLEDELEKVVRVLIRNRWPFRLHATYNESISRFLTIFEKVNKDIPFKGIPWFFDHCETVDESNLERIKALGGGIAIQNRMAFQGEYFVDRYGKEAAEKTPPMKKMVEMGIPVGAGTDGTRVSSYNPWLSLYWLATGKTMGGLQLYQENNVFSREDALDLYTRGSAYFSNDASIKGAIKVGMLADLVVLDADYFTVKDEDIKKIEAEMTIMDGKIVYAKGSFSMEAPPEIPILPDWSPSFITKGYYSEEYALNARKINAAKSELNANATQLANQVHCCIGSCGVHGHNHNFARLSNIPVKDFTNFWGILGCNCFAF